MLEEILRLFRHHACGLMRSAEGLAAIRLVMMLAAHPATRMNPMPTKDNTGSES